MDNTLNSTYRLSGQLEQLLLELPASLHSAGLGGQRCLHAALQDLETVLAGLHQQILQGLPADAAERDRLRTLLHSTRSRMEQSMQVLAHLQRWVDERTREAAAKQNYGVRDGSGLRGKGIYGSPVAGRGPLHGGLEAQG